MVEITSTFVKLASRDFDKSDICRLERFIVLLYDGSSTLEDVGCLQRREDRLIQYHQQEMHSFNTFGEQPVKLASLHSSFQLKSTFQFNQGVQHNRFGCYVTIFRHVWRQSLQKTQVLPDILQWGWKNGINGPEPLRMTQSDAEKNLRKLKRCNCANGCNARCTCPKFDLPCTELCLCNGKHN